jgi:IS605 OrfB family transposase
VYNRTLEYIKYKGHPPEFQPLRNILVTADSKMDTSTYKYYNIPINNLKQKIKDEEDPDRINILNELLKQEKRDLTEALRLVKPKQNNLLSKFELDTSKCIRANAVKSVCDAHKSAFSNLKAGHIKFFNMSFKRKKDKKKCIELDSCEVKVENKKIIICSETLHQNLPDSIKNSLSEEETSNLPKFKISNKNKKKYGLLVINHNCDLVYQKNNYYLLIPVPVNTANQQVIDPPVNKTICGGDPGIRTFLTTYNNKNEVFEYKSNRSLMKHLNDKLKFLKQGRTKPVKEKQRSGFRKKQMNKLEKKKIDLTDALHWRVINHLVSTNDVMFIGDIKSHDIVKNGKNRTTNQEFNDMKFHIFKERLEYKSSINRKNIFFINEAYTSRCCSHCGKLRLIGSSEVYQCFTCNKTFGRDENSAKNIMMKGILKYFS